MKHRQLGSSDLQVSVWCLGGNVFGWTAGEDASFAVLDAYVAAGGNFIDTADVYSIWAPGHQGGESETILGNWFQRTGNRSKIILATKVGMELGPDRKGLSKKWIFQAVEDSLRRLQTDYIDLYQSHKDDPAAPLEETLDAYAQLMKQGKIRAIGASNYGADRLRSAIELSERNGLPRYVSLQPHYNLYTRAEFEAALQPLCQEKNIGVIPYFSLASGFLTGKYRSQADLAQSPRGQSVGKYLDARGFRILAALDEVAAGHNSTPSRVALAWLLAQPAVTAPIASATSPRQVEDLAAAAALELDAASLSKLSEASA